MTNIFEGFGKKAKKGLKIGLTAGVMATIPLVSAEAQGVPKEKGSLMQINILPKYIKFGLLPIGTTDLDFQNLSKEKLDILALQYKKMIEDKYPFVAGIVVKEDTIRHNIVLTKEKIIKDEEYGHIQMSQKQKDDWFKKMYSVKENRGKKMMRGDGVWVSIILSDDPNWVALTVEAKKDEDKTAKTIILTKKIKDMGAYVSSNNNK